MASLAQLRQELAEAEDGIATCNQALELDPNDADAKELREFQQEQVVDLKAQIAAIQAESASAPPPPPRDDNVPPPPPPKFDMSKHPKFRKTSPDASTPHEEVRTVFNVGDTVQAKYSADKSWYPATIVSKTGSTSDPVYTVKFTGYTDKEQKRQHEVRPIIENKKRKADGPPVPSHVGIPPPPASPKSSLNGTVISAAPQIDTDLVPKREPSKVSDGPTRMAPAPKKLKGNRTLEKSKSSWNDWQKSGPKKPAVGGAPKKKDSQFRTPDLPNAKGEFVVLTWKVLLLILHLVGFTGSGKPMTKDQTRAKWNYGQPTDDD